MFLKDVLKCKKPCEFKVALFATSKESEQYDMHAFVKNFLLII